MKRGFTLIECLTSVIIFSIVSIPIFLVIRTNSYKSNVISDNVNSYHEYLSFRKELDLMCLDKNLKVIQKTSSKLLLSSNDNKLLLVKGGKININGETYPYTVKDIIYENNFYTIKYLYQDLIISFKIEIY